MLQVILVDISQPPDCSPMHLLAYIVDTVVQAVNWLPRVLNLKKQAFSWRFLGFVLTCFMAPAFALAAKPTISVTVTPQQLTAGQPYSIAWTTRNAVMVTLECTNAGPNEGWLDPNGQYNGIARGEWVNAPPSCTLTAWGVSDETTTKTVTLPTKGIPVPIKNSALTLQNMPYPLVEGQTYPVSLTFANNGETTWNAAEGYSLGNIGGVFPGAGNIPVDPAVAPGQQRTFTFNITAPAPGRYYPSWRMLFQGAGFGAAAENLVDVVPKTLNAQVIAQNAVSEMTEGRPYTVSVTVRNTSNVTWEPSTRFRLGSQNLQEWGAGRVELSRPVPPNGDYTFVFNVVAPAPNTYAMRWQMLQEEVAWFGEVTNIPVIVRPVPQVPTINVQRLPSPLVAGEAYSVNWTSTGATSVMYTCTAQGTGYQANATVDPNGTLTGTASAFWQNYPSTCTWTATGPGGTKTLTETVTTVPSKSSPATPNSVSITPPHLGNRTAGTLPGSLSVGRSGSANYSIPIEVPPGTNAVQPNLSLSYDSQSPNGPVGLGWSLGGMSSIHRCGKTIDQDGINERISFTNSDRLCLDGQRLVLVNRAVSDDNYWAPKAEYRTEIESFTRVTSDNTGPSGKLSFKVETKDGRISFYGTGSGQVQAYVREIKSGVGGTQPQPKNAPQSWAIDRTQDRLGNYIEYNYEQDQATGEHHINFIRYGGVGLTPHAAVKFVHEARPDAWKRYIDESRNDLRMRLSAIRTYVGNDLSGDVTTAGKLVRDYALTYETSPTSGRSMLKSVQVCAPHPDTGVRDCLRETTFNWGKPSTAKSPGFVSRGMWNGAPILTTHNPGVFGNSGANHVEYFIFSDFNLDGRVDVLEKRVASPIPADRGTPEGDEREASNPITVGTLRTQYRYFYNTGTGFSTHMYQLDTLEPFVTLDVGDFNGDGALDLLVVANNTPKICLSPLATKSGAPTGIVTFTCGKALLAPWRNTTGGTAYIFDPLGDGRSAAYTTIGNAGNATLCTISTCISDTNPPLIIGKNDKNLINPYDGNPDSRSREFISFNQMVDFAGNGKPFDVRWTQPYFEQYTSDGGEQVGSNTWYNLTPQVAISGIGWPGQATSKVASYLYPEPGPTGQTYTGTLRAYYTFDKPYQGNALSADFNGSGYTSLFFGYVEIGWDSNAKPFNKKAEATLCLSTGRALDCRVRQKYSGAEYRSIKAVGNFVGDGAPAVMVSPLMPVPNGIPMPSGAVQMCRITGDDPTDGVNANDPTMACTPWPGMTLPEDAPGALIDQVYFMDLLGTGRTQLVYYHSGKYINGVWKQDGRWEVFEPIDVAEDGQALDRMVSVTNGLGATSSVEYVDGLPTGTVGSSGTMSFQYPVQQTPQTGKIVRQLTTSNGVGDARRVTYQYRDAATHVAGRGSLGFASVISTDQQTGFITTTRYSQEWPRVGMVLSSSTAAGNCIISKTDNVLDVAAISQVNGIPTRYPYVKTTSTTRRDIDPNCSDLGTVSTAVTALDAWANVKVQEVTSKDSLETFVTKTQTDYRNDTVRWLLGLPTHTVLTKTTSAPQTSRQRTMDFDYDTVTGLLKQEIVEKGNVQLQVTTDYERANAFGLVSKKTQRWFDPVDKRDDARSVGTTYDPKGRYPATVTNAAGHVETHAYYPETGARKSITDANQITTSWVMDAFGRPAKEVHVDGNEVRLYIKACQGDCPAGAVVAQITDTFHGGDRITVPQVVYSDSAGHVVRALTWGFDARPVITEQRYDARGRLFEKDQPRFESEPAYLESRITVYDNFDRVREIVRYDDVGALKPSITTYVGLKTELTNALGAKRIEQRNVIGQIKTVTDPNNKVTSFEYEPFGGLAKTVDPNQNVIRVEYDNLGRKTALRDPNLGYIEYIVDPLGRTITQISPNQRKKFNTTGLEQEKTRTRYDKLDRMIARYEPDLESHWVFDTAAKGIGKLAEAYTQTGAGKDYRRVHAYDALGRPGKTTQSLTDGTYAATPGYDAWGRLISQTYQRNGDPAKVFDTRYSSTGYLARIERGSLVLWQVNGQDASLRPTSIALGNGLKQTRGFYPHSGRMKNGVLATAGGEPRLQEGYDYDVLGNVVVRTQHWDLGFREVFEYDKLNRIKLSQVDGQPAQIFTYDASGNLLSKTGVGTGNYVYPQQGATAIRPHAVQSIPGVGSFAYDDNGNFLSGGNRSVTWTSFDMPDKINGTGTSAQFVYGSEHQRTRQTRGDGTTVIYAGAQEIETNASGTTVKTYWPNGIGVEIDRPNAAVSELYWHHLDRLGSVIGLTDQQGVLKEKLAYDTWGKRRTTEGKPVEGTPTPNSLDGKVDNRGFTGHEMLDQLDLVHMNGRVYDPFTGKFMSGDPLIQDPIDGQNYNRYSYVLNNPTNNTDPTGFECETMTGSRICGVDTGASCMGNCNSGMFHVDKSRPHDNDLKKKGEGKTDAKLGGNVNSSSKAGQDEKNSANNFTSSKPNPDGSLGMDYDEEGNYHGKRGPRAEDSEFTIGNKRFVLKGGTTDQQAEAEKATRELMETPIGKGKMLPALESRRSFFFFDKDFVIDMRNVQNNAYVSPLNRDQIKIDPYYRPVIETVVGRIYADFRRTLWHEFGHAALLIDDNNYRNQRKMENVIKVENPLMRLIGQPERTRYDVK